MPDESHGSVTFFFAQLRQGDPAAAEKLWEQFGPRLLRLARKTLGGRRQRVVDADDAVQSAFFSFWKRAVRGDFVGDIHRHNLWNLLAKITVRKVLKQQEREGAQKRGGGRVHGESSVLGRKNEGLDQAVAQVPAQHFDLVCEEMLMQLDEEMRAVALLKLMNYTNEQVASILEFSVSKVERKLRLIRKTWKTE